MVTKTKRVKNVTKVMARDFNLPEVLNNENDLLTVELDRIHPSPLEPQAKRRERIKSEDLSELAKEVNAN